MKRIVCSSFWKQGLVLLIVLGLFFISSPTALAATNASGVYLGSGNVYYANGDIDYDIRGYVYYNSNTTTALDLSSMVQWIYNYGVYDIDEAHFIAHDGEFINYIQARAYINGVSAGENTRIEADWESICASDGKSHIYAKNTADRFAYTNMASGYSYSTIGGWSSYWFPSTREDDFHF